MLLLAFYTILINFGLSTSDNILKDIETTHTFIADDLLAGIIPNILDSWDSIKTGFSSLERNKTGPEKQSAWDGILQKLKPFHVAIRDVDRLVFENSPSTTLNPIVNISIDELKELTERVEKHDTTMEWLDKVKESWTRISSLTSQIHWKYNWIFDHIFLEGDTLFSKDDLHDILNETLHLYHAWYRVPDRGDEEQQRTLDLNELSDFSKTVAAASGEPKNMFRGLRDLLGKGGATEAGSGAENATDPCPGNETFAGKKGGVNKAIPVYVLLHLLNSEFKYFLMRNIADMYNCVHHGVCPYETTRDATKEHLNSYYQFYYSGIVEAFNDNSEEDGASTKIPESIWRWRCDPPLLTEETPTPEHPPRRDHRENVTFTRLYDFATAFIADERNISLTQTCRESCDMFDGGYSSIPCEEDNWNCLEAEKQFDCFERLMGGMTCPARARTICPNEGLSCHTTPIMKADMCKVPKSKRFIEWIESDVDAMKIMGKKTDCDAKDMENLVVNDQVERSAATKYEPQKCEVCLCTCYEPLGDDTHRFISLTPQEADIANGYILIGTKFAKVDKIIHVLIAEAKLANGEVDVSTIRWKEAKPVNTSDSTQVFRIGKNAKRILLDDFIAPVGHIVTGIKLTTRPIPRPEDYKTDAALKVDIVYLLNENGPQTWHYGFEDSELALEVRTTPLDKDGTLKTEESKWMSNSNNSATRTEVTIEDPDEPTFSVNASLPASFANEFIVIQSSSMAKDAGQTPVPFFDAQELLENEKLAPIRAIGLFYKGLPGYGGFLAFRQVSVPGNDSPKIPGFDLWGSLKAKKNKTE